MKIKKVIGLMNIKKKAGGFIHAPAPFDGAVRDSAPWNSVFRGAIIERRHDFTQRVYDVVRRIPKGQVMSYAEVARRAGSPRAYRAVGNAMRHNPDWPHIPCHRVIKSHGVLGNWTGKGGVKKKIALLTREGVKIKNGRVVLQYKNK